MYISSSITTPVLLATSRQQAGYIASAVIPVDFRVPSKLGFASMKVVLMMHSGLWA